MKKYMFLLGFAITIGTSSAVFAQDPAIMPDSIWHSSTSWFRNGTAFCYFNGATYAFIWTKEVEKVTLETNWYPYVYIFTDNEMKPFETENSPKLILNYPYEDEGYYCGVYRKEVTIIGNTFAFSYYGYLWFSCVIQQPPHAFVNNPDVYYQLWARFDPSENKWTTWHHTFNSVPTTYNVGATQIDTLLHMVYYNGTNSPYGLRKDLYVFDPVTKDISFAEHSDLNLPGKKFGGMFAYKDTEGNTNYVYNTFDEGSALYVTYHGPLIGNHSYSKSGVGASVMMQGSAQGKRPNETLSVLEGNRFNVFYLGNNKQSDNSYPLYNWEWIIQKNAWGNLYGGREAVVTLPTTYTPRQNDGHWQIGITMAMIPTDFDTQLDEKDGLEKKLMVFYPDKDAYLNGAIFNSDTWRPVPNSILMSTDLANDSLYGPEIRKLWTLVGIADGAPPCSINWHVWDSTLNLNQHAEAPTEFKFSTEAVQTSEVTSTYEDAYSIGTQISVGYHKYFGADLGFEYAKSFKTMVSSSNTVKTKISTNFALNDESQEHGYYIWKIPQIARITYMVYPWFDIGSQYPIEATKQFRFITLGATLMVENIGINEFPFLINEPNDPHLFDFTANGRQDMVNNALNHGLAPIGSISWTNPNPGGWFNFEQINKSVNSIDTTTSYKWDESMYVAYPGIFKVSEDISMDISYSTEYTYETEFGNEVEISLENLVRKNHGVNFSNYSVNVYWFKPDKTNWWYLQGLEGQKPWYIGYVVTTLTPKLTLLSPEPNTHIRDSEMLFCWQAEDGELYDYELFISQDPTAGPGSTVYRLPCGDKTAISLEGFTPEKGINYYWSVRGISSKGEPVWSSSRRFATVMDHSDLAVNELKVTIYPNPARNGQVSVAYDLPDAGRVSVYLYDISGHLLQQNEQDYQPAGINTGQIEIKNYAPGIYIVRIQTGTANATRKLVIR